MGVVCAMYEVLPGCKKPKEYKDQTNEYSHKDICDTAEDVLWQRRFRSQAAAEINSDHVWP